MLILGISAFYHDSAACLLRDGDIVAAAQEERFSRRKHDDGFPRQALDYCLAEAGATAGDLDWIVFYDKPLNKLDRLLSTYLAYAPAGFGSFLRAMPPWLHAKLHVRAELDRGLGGKYRGRYLFTEHHQAHAASAFFPSPFQEAAVLTMDGVGEWATATYGMGRGNRLELTHELRFPHSLGLLYSAFTFFAGFRVNSGEYKLMGLAPYGEPRYARTILEKLIDLKPDGSFRMDMRYFNYCQGLTMTGEAFADLFGGPPRQPEGPLTQREMDLAASVQAVAEEIMLRCARHVRRETGMKNLVLAGGVALNCVANGRIAREGIFEHVWAQPAAGDAGGALGAALFAWHQLLDKPREADGVHDRQCASLLGPRFGNDEIGRFLEQRGARFSRYSCEDELIEEVSARLESGQVVAFFHGRMEFGPRALGARSILGDARRPEMQSKMNLKIKFRESFRPFAPSIMAEHAHRFFDVPEGFDSPYMMFVAPLRQDKRLPAAAVPGRFDQAIDEVRSTVPAVTHVDYSARLQTVDPQRHGRFYRLLSRFYQRTGCPLLINTSFNVRGEPIVCSPEDAWRCFTMTHIDVLVLEDFLLLKEQQDARTVPDLEARRTGLPLD